MPMITTSGARLFVTKEARGFDAARRIRLQWGWMNHHAKTPGIARVMGLTQKDGGAYQGYEMEYLNTPEWPLRPERAAALTHSVLWILRYGVWINPPWVDAPWIPGAYFDRLLEPYPYARIWFDKVWESQGYCDTHGDPTLENALLDPTDGTVKLTDNLLDPILDAKVPSIRALDLGKVLQSALRYEEVKRGLRMNWGPRSGVAWQVKRMCRTRQEWELSKWFCFFHVLRFIPYQESEVADKWTSWLPEIVRWLRSTSMAY